MKRIFTLIVCCLLYLLSITSTATAGPGDTTVVQTFYYDTTLRAGVFIFPSDTTITYEKIVMLYSMRCKDGLVSSGGQPNIGCGEWDYNCYTFLVDSTQTDSLLTISNSHAISNSSDTSFDYTASQVYAYTLYNQQQVTYNNTISETVYTLGSGSTNLQHPLGAAIPVSKNQYLFRASELTSAGLVADSITGLRLEILATGSGLSNLRIRMRTTTQTQLDPAAPVTDGFTEVYFINTPVSAVGSQSFNFHTPFYWDGTSNIIVEYSYTNASPGTDNIVYGYDPGFAANLSAASPDRYLAFNHNTSLVKLNSNFYNNISNEITVAFWAYGDPVRMPANTSIMEAYDAANRRQLNIHLPWSDSNIYWDCGNDGTGYDRINKLATTADIEGKWNFWAFTKNATTGQMKIYLNGVLWHSGTGKTKPIDISNFLAGKGISNIGYYGNLDELSIWNKELSLTSVQQIMYSDITAAHPDYAFLQSYQKFNEASGGIAVDGSSNGNDAEAINPTRISHNGNGLFRNFTASNQRPVTQFVVGEYNQTITTVATLDSVPVPATSVISYAVASSGHSLQVIDTLYVWPSGYAYIYNTSGAVIDSIPVSAQGTVNVSQLTYHQVRPMYMELINFITPYGINLNLGMQGKTWAFDVTDFAPVLKGPRHIEMRDGIYQEDIDIKFVFYEGTPPRDVKSISQIWPSGSWVSPSYNDIVNNRYFEPRDIALDANATQFKLRSAISGHGQEGEFVPRNHTLRLNNSINFTRQVWKECATNPIYPQGGTWIYDRAGWCPGAAVDVKEYDITPNVTPGQSINLDYSLPAVANPGQSNYRVNNQLVTYGPINFSLDAAVDYVKSPTKRVEYQRFNPLCNEPVVAIKNTGSTPLTSLTITYGRKGGTMSTYNWTGNLAFLASAEVTLPQPAWNSSSVNEFVVYVSNPNGSADQYAYNDTLYSEFNIPVTLNQNVYFELKTNNYSTQNSYTLKDAQGTTIISRSGLAANTIYRDTVSLLPDCYTVYLTDNGDDGLSFWANTAQGSGYFRVRNVSNGGVVLNFNPDFGDNVYAQFTVGYSLPVEDPQAPIWSFSVYPSPASDIVTAEISMPLYSDVQLRLMNMLGEEVISQQLSVTQQLEKVALDVSGITSGIYYLVAETGTSRQVKKVVISR